MSDQPPDRLRELARITAERKHDECVRSEAHHATEQPNQSMHPDWFEACPHPDCVLVRTPLANPFKELYESCREERQRLAARLATTALELDAVRESAPPEIPLRDSSDAALVGQIRNWREYGRRYTTHAIDALIENLIDAYTRAKAERPGVSVEAVRENNHESRSPDGDGQAGMTSVWDRKARP